MPKRQEQCARHCKMTVQLHHQRGTKENKEKGDKEKEREKQNKAKHTVVSRLSGAEFHIIMYTLSAKRVTTTLPSLPIGTSNSLPDLYPILATCWPRK
jgi:hypothetical protein